MNNLFISELVEILENSIDVVKTTSQEALKESLLEYGDSYLYFPMISFEHTNDSNIDVDVDESKFLNDSAHKGTWIMGGSVDSIDFVLNLKENGNNLEIDAIEVNEKLRGEGLGGNLVSIIECVAEEYYKNIVVSPFDTDAMNFWEHMEYSEAKDGYWVKTLN